MLTNGPYPHLGAIVHYIEEGYDHKAAIVTYVSRIDKDNVALTVFNFDWEIRLVNVIRGDTPGTWHWPEKVPGN